MAELEIEALSKRYGNLVALDGASLGAYAGEVHALLGENGAGKSTLIRVLSGVVPCGDGRIVLDGRELTLSGPASARRAGIRTAFQELSFIPDLSVAENLLFDGPPVDRIGRVPRRRLEREARELLDGLGIHQIDPSAPSSSLGLGQRQLLEVVKALRVPPRVLVLDESTSALSREDSEWVLAKAREVADAGAVVLLISHRMGEVRTSADRITILRSGMTVAAGPATELDDDSIIEAMLGRRIERLYPARAKAPGEPVLEVRDFTVGQKLGPLDLTVRRGEILGIAGLQGQGQRSLVMGLGGALPWHGTMRLAGAEYAPREPRQALAAGVALVPEDRQREGLFLSHSVRRNISIASLDRLKKFLIAIDPGLEARMTVAQSERMKLPAARLEHPVSVLSGGNQQKVIFSKVLLTEPKLLLLYDCTRGVDVGTKAEIFQVMVDLAEDGVGVVFYSSDLSELVNMCDRVAVLHEGRVTGVLDGGEIDENRILRLAVGAQESVVAAARGGAE